MTGHIESITVSYKRFSTEDNKPTCALNFRTKDVCVFYRTQNFGQTEFCLFTGNKIFRQNEGGKEIGHTIPTPDCPLWTEEEMTMYSGEAHERY